MTTEEEEEEVQGLLINIAMAFLGTSNLLTDAKLSVGGDSELEALGDVMLAAHFYINERRRTRSQTLGTLMTDHAAKLSMKSQALADKLSAAADVISRNQKERLAATKDQIAVQSNSVGIERMRLSEPATV